MHTSLKLILAFSFISIMFYSCASMSDVLESKNEGSVQTFSVNLDRAWEISITVLRWEGCETIEEQVRGLYAHNRWNWVHPEHW